MNTLPWHRPEEKPDVGEKILGVTRNGGFQRARYNSEIDHIGAHPRMLYLGWLYESDLLSDFQRWLAGDKMTPTEPQTVEEQVSPSDSWKDVPDPDKWLRDVRGYEDESGEGRG